MDSMSPFHAMSKSTHPAFFNSRPASDTERYLLTSMETRSPA
jgi:hypothetical protein